MFRVGVVKANGKVEGKNFDTKQQADNYVLSMAEKEGLKSARILNKKTKEIEVLAL